MTQHVRALIAEFAGTFMFFAIGAGAIVAQVDGGSRPGDLLAIALAHGLALAVAISVFGAISGGHFNPAVTFGLAVANKHPWPQVPTYWAAQLAGGVLAGLVVAAAFDSKGAAADLAKLGTPMVAAGVPWGTAVLVETVLTLFLLWAVFGTAVSPNAPRIAGFGIGLMVTADILMGGPITGAAMNPARHFGPAAVANFWDNWHVYWVGPLLGAAIAGLSYRYVFGAEQERDPLPLPADDADRGAPRGRPLIEAIPPDDSAARRTRDRTERIDTP